MKIQNRLENLPNEILLQIIQFVGSPDDIYRSFHGLNQRFHSLIHRISLSLDVFCEDKEYFFLTEYFQWNFHRLCLFSNCPSIRFDRFRCLRSLTIVEPTDAQILSIDPQTFPHLEYLSSPATINIFDCLFGRQSDQWSNLRSVHFYFCHISRLKSTWKINSILQTLSGIICSRSILSELLSLLPRLKHLRIEMISSDLSRWNSSIFDRTLSSLHIRFHQFYLDDLCQFIGSNLIRLQIEILSEENSIDFSSLADALLFHLSKPLKLFQMDYRGEKLRCESIRRCHPLFENLRSVSSSSSDTHRLICQQFF